MLIGELADRVGVSADTIRFYERSGWLPRPARRSNSYREYTTEDAEHLRLLIDLRRLDVGPADAAQIATWCHSGHCRDTNAVLPAVIAARRAAIEERIASLRALDDRLSTLERHLDRPRRTLAVLDQTGEPCCDAAAAVVGTAEGTCACCAVPSPA